MKNNRLYVPLLLALLISVTATGQQQSTMYYMNLPQNHFLNPAFKPSNGFYLGLPAISGVNFNFNTNFIGFSDVFRYSLTGDSIISVLHPDFDADAFLEKISNRNYISPDVNVQTLGLGFRAGKDLYIFIDVNEKISGGVVLPGDIFDLALNGNEGFIGDRIDLTSLDANLMYYREFAAGFSKDFSKRLRIGVRGRMLMGIASLSMENRNLAISVLDDYSHRMNTDVTINISAPVTVVMNEDNGIDDLIVDEKRFEDPGFYLNTSNLGFGLDIGAVYMLNQKISLSAAINGVGYINWKSDITNLTGGNEFTFTGFDLSDVIEGDREFEELADELLDSLKNSFTINDHSEPFKTMLPGVLTLGASYNVTENLSLGIVSNTLLKSGNLRASLMLSANANIGSSLSAGLSYTAINQTYDNLGAGFAFRLGPVQLYTVADKIPIMFNKVIIPDDGGEDLNLLLPDNWNTLTIRVGMNLVFGNKIKKKSDKPMITTVEVN